MMRRDAWPRSCKAIILRFERLDQRQCLSADWSVLTILSPEMSQEEIAESAGTLESTDRDGSVLAWLPIDPHVDQDLLPEEPIPEEQILEEPAPETTEPVIPAPGNPQPNTSPLEGQQPIVPVPEESGGIEVPIIDAQEPSEPNDDSSQSPQEPGVGLPSVLVTDSDSKLAPPVSFSEGSYPLVQPVIGLPVIQPVIHDAGRLSGNSNPIRQDITVLISDRTQSASPIAVKELDLDSTEARIPAANVLELDHELEPDLPVENKAVAIAKAKQFTRHKHLDLALRSQAASTHLPLTEKLAHLEPNRNSLILDEQQHVGLELIDNLAEITNGPEVSLVAFRSDKRNLTEVQPGSYEVWALSADAVVGNNYPPKWLVVESTVVASDAVPSAMDQPPASAGVYRLLIAGLIAIPTSAGSRRLLFRLRRDKC